MTHWHAASCERPAVDLSDDKWPFCRSCAKSCPPLDQLIALDQASNYASPLTLPPDEIQGQMNLYWPNCVRYVQLESESAQSDSKVRPRKEKPQKNAAPTDHLMHIYDTALTANEFRIAYISAPLNDDHPVHVAFEIHSHDNHPEYEAVSYLWGGEDGDNSRSRPVFIGPHWDVLLQTRNCWSMLKFFRLRRGERSLWVDALCINQQNLDERATQVAMMGRIYEKCARVVVYLGEDIVTWTTSFPHYRMLDELATIETSGSVFPNSHPKHGTQFGVKELLTRRYFTRIWVIQELVRSERVVLRIGDVDFRADARTMAQLEDACNRMDWSSTAAPWVQCMAQKSFVTLAAAEIYALLKFTQQSACSDPRDHLFGVIGLLRDADARQQFRPCYDLSYLHFCIGLFGSWIINDMAFHLIQQAGTLAQASPCRPSWLPICDSPGFWN